MAIEAAKDNLRIEEMDEDDLVEEVGFSFSQRRLHYRKKIRKLEKLDESLRAETLEIDKNRTRLTFSMKDKQKRQMDLKLEMQRLKNFKGTSVSSSVLHGSAMQYQIDDYRVRVDKAYNKCLQEISSMKFQVMKGEERKQRIKFELQRAEDLRKERQAAFLDFEKAHQKKMTLMKKLKSDIGNESNGISNEKLLRKYFDELKSNREERLQERERVTNLFLRMMHRLKRSAFMRWKTGEVVDSSDGRNPVISGIKNEVASLGSKLLQQSKEKRVQLQGMLRDLIVGTATIKQNLYLAGIPRDTKAKLVQSNHFKAMDEGLDHIDLNSSKGMKFLYEGDGYALDNKFESAKHMYDAQIIFLRSKPSIDIKMLSICHGRLGKMFLKLGKKNRAIVEFDRQLSLAKEIDDEADKADAYFGIGSGYLLCFDYDNAIRYLNIAQIAFEAIGNIPKYCGVMRSLMECYDRLNVPDKVVFFQSKIDFLENNLRTKLFTMHFKLDDMKDRLISTTAEIEHVVEIERVTLHCLYLRQRVEMEKDHLVECEKDFYDQEDVCHEIEAILIAIEEEMNKAIETDELEMFSALVHDQPQVVEIEELKARLKARSEKELNRLREEKDKLKAIGVTVKNVKDNIRYGQSFINLFICLKHTVMQN